jgi:hypothetical protein
MDDGTLGAENSEFYAVIEGLTEGDSIIIEGTHTATLSKIRIVELIS